MVKIANLKNNSNWKMPGTPSKMPMHDMVMIDSMIL